MSMYESRTGKAECHTGMKSCARLAMFASSGDFLGNGHTRLENGNTVAGNESISKYPVDLIWRVFHTSSTCAEALSFRHCRDRGTAPVSREFRDMVYR